MFSWWHILSSLIPIIFCRCPCEYLEVFMESLTQLILLFLTEGGVDPKCFTILPFYFRYFFNVCLAGVNCSDYFFDFLLFSKEFIEGSDNDSVMGGKHIYLIKWCIENYCQIAPNLYQNSTNFIVGNKGCDDNGFIILIPSS